MNELISISEAAKILDIAIPTVAYYIKKGSLRIEYSDKRTAGRRQKRLVYREDVLKLKERLDAAPPTKEQP